MNRAFKGFLQFSLLFSDSKKPSRIFASVIFFFKTRTHVPESLTDFQSWKSLKSLPVPNSSHFFRHPWSEKSRGFDFSQA